VARSSLAATRRQVYSDLHGDVASSVEDSLALLDEHMRTADYAEGVRALTEKRPPDFA